MTDAAEMREIGCLVAEEIKTTGSLYTRTRESREVETDWLFSRQLTKAVMPLQVMEDGIWTAIIYRCVLHRYTFYPALTREI